MAHSRLYRWFGRPQTLDEFIDKATKSGVNEFYVTPYVFYGFMTREGLHYISGVALRGLNRKIRYQHLTGQSVGINPFNPERNNREFHLEVLRHLKEVTAEETQKVTDSLRSSGFETQLKDFILEVGVGSRKNTFHTLESDGGVKEIPKPETI